MTVYARNYPESDSRSKQSSKSVSFTVKQRVVTPTVTLPSIADQTVGNTVTVKGSATTPCYRMSAKVVHNGVTKWLGDQSGASYSKTYTVPEAGQYGVTLYARSYPESDARSGQGVKTVWFNAYNPVIPTVNLNSITGTKKVGGVITVSGTSSTPCYRMAAKVEHDGVRNWLGEVSGSTYSKTYTIPEPGTYTVTLISRSYAESDVRTGTAEDSVTFTVTGDSKVLSMQLIDQKDDDSCGCTAAVMMLSTYGIQVSKDEFVKRLQAKYPGQKTYTYAITDFINIYLREHGIATEYHWVTLKDNDPTSAEFFAMVKKNINAGYPLEVQLNIPLSDSYFPSSTDGHYVAIKGYSGSNLIINDSYPGSPQVVTAPNSTVLNYIKGHDYGYGICVLD